MRVAYFPNSCARNSEPVMQALLQSLRARGHEPVADAWDADAALIWSVLWSGRMAPNQAVYDHYRSRNLPVIVVDVGALYRGETWKIAINNITAQGYYGHEQDLDWDRPRRLGISLAINLNRNPRIVIALQHQNSLQVAQVDYVDWVRQQVQRIQQVTDRPLVIRPHPRSRWTECLPGTVIEKPQRMVNTYDSYNLTFDCHALINYNSGAGIQAALAGTRPLVDKTSLAHPVGIDLADLEQPYVVDRDRWLVEICHTEYLVPEIAQGLWLDRTQALS